MRTEVSGVGVCARCLNSNTELFLARQQQNEIGKVHDFSGTKSQFDFSFGQVFHPFCGPHEMAALSQPANKILQSLNGCEISDMAKIVNTHTTSKMQHMLEVFDSLSKRSWAAENATRLEAMASTMVEELTSHSAFYAKNGAEFEGIPCDL
jgi:hypothetical protein